LFLAAGRSPYHARDTRVIDAADLTAPEPFSPKISKKLTSVTRAVEVQAFALVPTGGFMERRAFQ